MSFGFLFENLLKALNLVNEAVRVIKEINKKKEEAKRELKSKGINVDLDIALIETNDGKVYGAIIVDLPGQMEVGIAEILRTLGFKVRVIKGEEL